MTAPNQPPPPPSAPKGQKPPPGTKCKYCEKPAVVNVTPAAGSGTVVPTCADHARVARKAVQSANGGGSGSSSGGNPFAKSGT